MRYSFLAWVLVPVAVVGGALLVAPADLAARPDPETLFRFRDPQLIESSGLVALSQDLVATVNDSGDDPVVYLVDTATGRTVGRTTYTTAEVTDVEALGPGPDGTLWVADIGDNDAERTSIAVHRLPPFAAGDRTVSAARFRLRYADGPHDAETLLVHPVSGQLFVVTKGLFGGAVYAAPPDLRPGRTAVLRRVGRTGGLVTDGAFLPDGRHAVLRTYDAAQLYDARTWQRLAQQRLPDQPQGEGLAVLASGQSLLVSTEGVRTRVVSVPLSRPMVIALERSAPPADAAERVRDRVAAQVAGVGWPVLAAVGAALVLVLVGAVALTTSRRRARSRR